MDNITKTVIHKYGLPIEWRWSKADRSRIERGMLVEGKAPSESQNKSYFISDEDLRGVKSD